MSALHDLEWDEFVLAILQARSCGIVSLHVGKHLRIFGRHSQVVEAIPIDRP
jgi:hypothetical protein